MGSSYLGQSFYSAGGTDAVANRYAAMQGIAMKNGVLEMNPELNKDPGAFLKVIDFISRPLYAVTGVADVLLGTYEQESDKYIVSRVLRELLGKGDKEFFGDVLKQAGIPEGGKLSDLIGNNFLTHRFDPGLRGTIAFGLDIFLDPLTYLGMGAFGRVSVISKGGKTALTAPGEKALSLLTDYKIGVVAKKLGRLGAVDKAGRRVAGENAYEAWMAAVRKGGKAKMDAFIRIENEAQERGLKLLKSVDDKKHRARILAVEARQSASDLLGKVIAGEAPESVTKKLLADLGLNPNATNLADEVAKLVDTNKIYYYVPFLMKRPVTLFELGKSGVGTRFMAKALNNPVHRAVMEVLQSHDGTRQVLEAARRAGTSVRTTLDRLFNQENMYARDVHGYLYERKGYTDYVKVEKGYLKQSLDAQYADFEAKPELVEEIAKIVDSGAVQKDDMFAITDDLAQRYGMEQEQIAQFMLEYTESVHLWGAADVMNGTLSPEQFARYDGRYVPHMINGWDDLTDQQRVLVANLYERVTGRKMNLEYGLGRFAEHRIFDTFDKLEDFLSMVNAKLNTNLTVNYDLKYLQAVRGLASIESNAIAEFLRVINRKFGRKLVFQNLGLMSAILPNLRGKFAQRMSRELTEDEMADLNFLLSTTKTVGDEFVQGTYFGIPYKQAVAHGLPKHVAEFVDMIGAGADHNTVVEFVNIVRTTTDEMGQAYQVLGSTRTMLQDDGTARTFIQLYEGADVTTVAKEYVGRRGWNLMAKEDRVKWQEFYGQHKDEWIDPETGEKFANARDAFAQMASDYALGQIRNEVKHPVWRKLFENVAEVFANLLQRVRALQSAIRKKDVPQDIVDIFERARTFSPNGDDLAGLGAEVWDRFGYEALQRKRLGFGTSIHPYDLTPLSLASAIPDGDMQMFVKMVRGEVKFPKEVGLNNARKLKAMRATKEVAQTKAHKYNIVTSADGTTEWHGDTRPAHKRTVLEKFDSKGNLVRRIVVGRKNVSDLVEENITSQTAENIRAWMSWYFTETAAFRKHFPDTWHDEFVATFLASQRLSPPIAFRMSLRQRANAAADLFDAQKKKLRPGAALPGKRLEKVFGGKSIGDEDIRKLIDFYDSGMFKLTRTFHGDVAESGQPLVIDVWSYRDAGYIDDVTLNWLKKEFGSKYLRSKGIRVSASLEDKVVPGRYENAADFLRQFAEYVRANADTIKSADGVTMREIMQHPEFGDLGQYDSSFQALGWMAKRTLLGQADYDVPTIGSNIWNLAYEVAFGAKSPFEAKFGEKWYSLSPAAKKRVTTQMSFEYAKAAMQVLKVPHKPSITVGVGMYQSWMNPNAVYSVPAAPEHIMEIASAIGYLSQQTEMFMQRVGAGPNIVMDIVLGNGHGLSTAKLDDFWQELHKAEPKLFEGATGVGPVQGASGDFALRIGLRGKKWYDKKTKHLSQELQDLVKRTADKYGITDVHIDAGDAENMSIKNDWKENPNGEAYLKHLESVGRQDAVELLRDLVPQFERQLDEILQGELERDAAAKAAGNPAVATGDALEVYFSSSVPELPIMARRSVPEGKVKSYDRLVGRIFRPSDAVNGPFVYKAKIDSGLIYTPSPGEVIDEDLLIRRGYVGVNMASDNSVDLLVHSIPVENAGTITDEAFQRRRSSIVAQHRIGTRPRPTQKDLDNWRLNKEEYTDPEALAAKIKALQAPDGYIYATDVADLLMQSGIFKPFHRLLEIIRPHIPDQAEFYIPYQHGWTKYGTPGSGKYNPILDRYVSDPGWSGLHLRYSDPSPTGKGGNETHIWTKPSFTEWKHQMTRFGMDFVQEASPSFRDPTGVNYRTIIHELIHAATYQRLDLGFRLSAQNAPQAQWDRLLGGGKQGAAAERTYNVFFDEITTDLTYALNAAWRSFMNANMPDEANMIGNFSKVALTDPHEILTYMLTEPMLREILQTTPATKNTSVFDKVAARIADDLGVTNSLASDLLTFLSYTTRVDMDFVEAYKGSRWLPSSTRWSREGFQRKKIDEGIDAHKRLAAERRKRFDLDPNTQRRRELKEQIAEKRVNVENFKKAKAESRAKQAGALEGAARERELRAETEFQNELSKITVLRQKLAQRYGIQRLKALQEFVNHETRAIQARSPELQLDLFGDPMPVSPQKRAGLERTKKNDLAKLDATVKAMRSKIIHDLDMPEAVELVEAVTRLQNHKVKMAQHQYAGRRFREESAKFSQEASQWEADIKAKRSEAQKLRDEMKALDPPKRLTIDDIKEENIQRLGKMSQTAQAAFFYQSLANIKDPEHLAKFLDKYEDVIMKIDNSVLVEAREALHQSFLESPFSPYGNPGRPQVWRKVEVNRPDGKKEVYELPQGIAEDLMQLNKHWLASEEVRGMLRLFDIGTNVFKTSVTVLFPAFHARNGWGNMFQSALDISLQAMNPVRHLEAISIMLGGTRAGARLGIPEFTMVDKLGNRYTGAQIRSLAEAYRIKVNYDDLVEIIEKGGADAYRLTGNKLLKALRSPLDIISKPGRAVGEAVEGEARMLHFITLLRRGLAPADAAMQVNKFLFDYSALSEFERNVMRRIVPFYTWNSKNLRMQIYSLTHKPGLWNNLQKPFNQDRGPEKDMLPEYMRGDLRIRLEPGPGKAAAFLTNMDLPMQNLDIMFSGTPEKTLRNNISLLNPLLKAPLEYAFGMDSFTGQKIHGAQYMGKLGPLLASFPKPMQEYFELQSYPDAQGNIRYLANGTKVYLVFKSWALSRIMGTAAEFAQAAQSDEQVLDWWRLMTGMQFREYDFDEAQKRMLRARYDRLEDEMIKRGLYLQFTTPYVRPDLKEEPDKQRNRLLPGLR